MHALGAKEFCYSECIDCFVQQAFRNFQNASDSNFKTEGFRVHGQVFIHGQNYEKYNAINKIKFHNQ